MSNNYIPINIFSIPLLIIKFENHYKYNFPEVEKKDHKPTTWVESLQTTFPSIPDNDPIVPTSVRDTLKLDLKNSIVNVFNEMNLPTNIEFINLWYNIYHDNQGQERHSHLCLTGQPNPFWSGVYYNKNSSPTTFYNDNRMIQSQRYVGYDKGALATCLAETCSPPVEDGDILLFPPYVEHSVQSKPEHKNDMRMTFSFNLELKGSTSEILY
mgnify:CR=1 FL=1|tara:strand:- start:289 stop:924 length:636 start_codon:yes stop_codon:yes gene_type:complete